MLFEIVQTRDTLGGITEIKENPFDLAPFVTRDSMYKYVLEHARRREHEAGRGRRSVSVHARAGFGAAVAGAAFNTTAWIRPVQSGPQGEGLRALRDGGRWRRCVAVRSHGARGIVPERVGDDAHAVRRRRVRHLCTVARHAERSDAGNEFDAVRSHVVPVRRADASERLAGRPLHGEDPHRACRPVQGPVTGDGPTSATTTLGFSIWPTTSSAIPIIRNEELILLRAEARLATGDKAGAIADLNQVRVNSGGLPASTLTAASTDDAILNGILYEKRYSTMMEGNRWVDMRRYNKLSALPLDIASGTEQELRPQGDADSAGGVPQSHRAGWSVRRPERPEQLQLIRTGKLK